MGRELKSEFLSKRQKILNSVFLENRSIDKNAFIEVLELSIEIAREGREGRKIGTLFVIGDEKKF